MSIKHIDESVIRRIGKGEEKAFALLYDCYYTYLNTVALCYIFNKNVANEIVNDQISRDLERKYDVTIQIADNTIKSEMFSGSIDMNLLLK